MHVQNNKSWEELQLIPEPNENCVLFSRPLGAGWCNDCYVERETLRRAELAVKNEEEITSGSVLKLFFIWAELAQVVAKDVP